MIRIVPYTKTCQDDFRRLNLYWLEHYGLTEQPDLDMLDHPEELILAPGGYLFLAMDEQQVVGSAGLIPERAGVFELVKMAVHPEWQGKGIGKMLLQQALEQAKNAGARKVILFSNSQLSTAIAMYAKQGFRHVEVKDTPLLTADVKMELSLI